MFLAECGFDFLNWLTCLFLYGLVGVVVLTSWLWLGRGLFAFIITWEKGVDLPLLNQMLMLSLIAGSGDCWPGGHAALGRLDGDRVC